MNTALIMSYSLSEHSLYNRENNTSIKGSWLYELAKKYDKTNKEFLDLMKEWGMDGKTHLSGLTEEEIKAVTAKMEQSSAKAEKSEGKEEKVEKIVKKENKAEVKKVKAIPAVLELDEEDEMEQEVLGKSKKNKVFISEQIAPDDFKCIWEKPFTRTLDVNKNNQFQVTEKLFTYSPKKI